ncbi:SPOC-domain-containing protein [Coniochaeta ligniaria NRRL 30616]|uniref:Transcription factor BYE1 n=1 Tax=Coniochaeta ligniaria NRRL 30616 TaxID=1408157 RepID=A0A1J7J6N4_9PEZI|nr:SPOC-domain-containing protein [Coniochaeta ligniaria NRRL 30616]
MSGEAEPRRSVRATKGQHKALDSFDQPIEPPKKRGKKGKKAAQEPEEEIIRCVCGATEQDEDSGEPWIACEQCSAWQHNVCMGISRYSEDVKDLDYWCEICRPEDHKELLEALDRGEKLWETRRRAYEEELAEEEAAEKKKKKGPKKAKGKRISDPKEEPKQSPAPEAKKEAKPAAAGKRKARDESQEKEPKPSQKLRKVSETQAVPVPVPVPAAPVVPSYTSPADIAAAISELSDTRQNAAKGLCKSLSTAISAAEKKGSFVPSDGISIAARAERFALQIERAVHDTHPAGSYAAQTRTLFYNLKSNPELALRLLKGILTPPMLAAMTTEELASKELKRETAEMKARAEKQSILLPEEQAPRVRRTHKGEELINDESAIEIEEPPVPQVRRSTIVRESESESLPPPPEAQEPAEPAVELPAHIEQTAAPRNALHIDTEQSPKTDFDINKVFSSVKSPTATANRRQSTLPAPPTGPGIDPEVDRMLRDDGNESPPYSPTEESDPDVVWRGNLLMNTIADFQVVAKHVGGAKLTETIGLPWATLFPKRLTVAGRIDQQKAVEYLCSLRYSSLTDIVVTSLEPATEGSKAAYDKLIDYFVSKARYGVVGDKGVGNVRDTYLVPVLPGTGGHPEFMLNLVDNFIPETRTEKMLLCVFVYRNDPETVQGRNSSHSSSQAVSQSPLMNTPTAPQAAFSQRNQSISAPQFSPTSPQGPLPNYQSPRNGQTPVQPPHVPRNTIPAQPQQLPQVTAQAQHDAAQREGERIAREVLGPLISSPTLAFIMPHAHRMLPKEWHLIREVYERDLLSREDLNRLSTLLAEGSRPPDEAGSMGPSQPGRGSQLQQPQAQAQAQPPPQPQPHPQLQPQPQYRAPPAHQTPIPPPVLPPQRTTPIPPPTVPAGPPRQTPIPPPNIPHHSPPTAASSAPTT